MTLQVDYPTKLEAFINQYGQPLLMEHCRADAEFDFNLGRAFAIHDTLADSPLQLSHLEREGAQIIEWLHKAMRAYKTGRVVVRFGSALLFFLAGAGIAALFS